jgi:GTP-binding protein
MENTNKRLSRVLLLGRPNVGKSTLFNRLLGRGVAITDATPHTTRDVLVGIAGIGRAHYEICDAAGFLDAPEDTLQISIRRGLDVAAREADLILLLFDARTGLVPVDRELADFVRKLRKPVIPVVNKVDGPARDDAVADFYELGFDADPFPISAKGGYNVRELEELVIAALGNLALEADGDLGTDALTVAIVGRPNVGKSSLLNCLAGEERVIVHEIPGTTRDAVDVTVVRGGRSYVFVDTAGIRRRTKAKEPLEEWSLAKSFAAIKRAAAVVLVVDGSEGPTSQDAKIAGYADNHGRAVAIFVNKTDLLPGGDDRLRDELENIRAEMPFASYAPVEVGSALKGIDVNVLYKHLDAIVENNVRRIGTGELNRYLKGAAEKRKFRLGDKELRLRYAVQIETRPPTFHLFLNTSAEPPAEFGRYIENRLREGFAFAGTPLVLYYRLRPGKADRK